MRILAFLLALALLMQPAWAQQWGSYHNERFGATADLPPGFEPAGPEAANSDGLIFRTRNGGLLTIYGANVPGGDFEAFVATTIAHDQSYNGYPISGQTVTPDWAEYWGGMSGRNLLVRLESSCNGRIAVVAKLEYSGNLNSTVDRVFGSLEAGSATAC